MEPAVLPKPSPLNDSVVTRRLSSRRRSAFLAWLVVGGIGTYVDKIHEALGVVAYPNPHWIGERLPVSPAYLVATVGFFMLYTAVVGHRGSVQGIFGGPPLSAVDIVYAFGSWIAAYCVSGYLGRPSALGGEGPIAAAVLLFLWALPPLWRARRTQLPIFALLVALLGILFEWSATAEGLFTYPVCPSDACLGATVPLLWLPLLYVHAALFFNRMLGGKHLFSRSRRRAT